MKVLIISDAWHPQVNGVVRTYEYLSRELEAMGHTVIVIGPAEFPVSLPMPGYSEIRLALLAKRRLKSKIDWIKPDLLHIATEGPLGLIARRHARENNMAFTTCYHTHFPDYAAKRVPSFMAGLVRNLAIRFVRWFHAPSSCVFVATGSLARTLKDWNFSAPLKTMTRGIDTAVFHPGPKNLFNGFARPVALYVGRVAVEKNLEAFLEMDWPGSKVVVGNGPDKGALEKKYTKAVFTGAKSGIELANYYRSADLFVFPSRTDTFGMVLVEALACGLPVAGYPVTGPVDIITDPALGALDDDLATAARNAMETGSPPVCAGHARERYSWPTAARQFLEWA